MDRDVKYVFVTGGVVSSLGKGIVAASLGMLLKSKGYRVTIQKLDPYLNMDPGTMSPYQHGEVFVTDDGTETDLDLGHYERFIDQSLNRFNSLTAGMVFWNVLDKERRGEYLGNTVQIIPHITNEIKDKILLTSKESQFDVVIVEVGGTIGDIESLPFIEAIRQFQFNNKGNCAHIHLTLVPYLGTSGEFKTKPTQHSVKELRSVGIQPDTIVCRCLMMLTEDIKSKIALFCDVPKSSVISAVDVDSIYDVPLVLENEKLDQIICHKLGLDLTPNEITEWKTFVQVLHDPTLMKIKIAVVGKYVNLSDCYLSVIEALKHASIFNSCQLEVEWVNAEDLEKGEVSQYLSDVDGILVPGGFGERGFEGKVKAAQYAREKDIPFLGLCLGMHVVVVEFGRHVLNLDANSAEFDSDVEHPVIDLLEDQKGVERKGGTMRLGDFPCKVLPDTLLSQAYDADEIYERHRHRYEFNNAYRTQYQAQGMVFSGVSPDDALVEVVELKDKKWFFACQFHPEFKSRPISGHPIYNGFILAVKENVTLQQALF